MKKAVPDDAAAHQHPSVPGQAGPLSDSSGRASAYLDALLRGSGTASPASGERNVTDDCGTPNSGRHEILLHADVHNDDPGPPHTDGHIDTGPDPHDDGYIDHGES